ncbi:hypothetical protein [Anaeromyxobacter paludicola]|uniref:Zinc ribbon domain-containing protein n=1 Tax=Anaeromyxobacter paludicola TaxID=2918171 RepID=A0ABM7X6Y6_9BACT|nr:hypothetical protein [Anaeromyxobacter paludicola]BDG07560.1 hypothetical protein AMPC_06730 [Anaeromyxobacter paludicola]
MARRAPATLEDLLARLASLEERVGRIESGRAPRGDGRAAKPPEPKRKVKRCPGCGLPLRRRAGRCVECGRPD